MALSIKNPAVERLATDLAQRLGASKTEAVRRTLEAHIERVAEPSPGARTVHLVAFLERDVRPLVPADALGRAPDERERERILGYGEEGVRSSNPAHSSRSCSAKRDGSASLLPSARNRAWRSARRP